MWLREPCARTAAPKVLRSAGKCVDHSTTASLLHSYFYKLQFGFYHAPPPLILLLLSSVLACVHVQVTSECELPQNKPEPSGMSWVFGILEGHCELIILSAHRQCPILNIFNNLVKLCGRFT